MKKIRRSVSQWIACKAGLDVKLTRDEWMAAYRIGATNRIEKPGWMAQVDYRDMLNEHAKIDYEYLVRGRRHLQSMTYEPPERNTGPTVQVLASDLKRLIGTQTLPVVKLGEHGMMDAYNKHKRKEQGGA